MLFHLVPDSIRHFGRVRTGTTVTLDYFEDAVTFILIFHELLGELLRVELLDERWLVGSFERHVFMGVFVV